MISLKKNKNTWIPFTQGKLSSNVIEFQFLHTNKLRCGLRVCVDVSHRIPPHTYLPAPAVQQTGRHPARSLRAATPLSDQIKPPRNDVPLCKTSAETLRKTERERENASEQRRMTGSEVMTTEGSGGILVLRIRGSHRKPATLLKI